MLPATHGVELRDLGVELSEDSDRDPLGWRFLLDGPQVMMTSATGMDGRGFRYLLAACPETGDFLAVSLVKLYATAREGVISVVHRGPDAAEALERINHFVRANADSPRLARGHQPVGSGPIDVPAALASLGRGDAVARPGWDDLDAAALRGYGGHVPERWPPAGTPCVMRYERPGR